jgi:hypothetical protein
MRVALSILLILLFYGDPRVENSSPKTDDPPDYFIHLFLNGDLLSVGKGDDRIGRFFHENDEIRVDYQGCMIQTGYHNHGQGSPFIITSIGL